MDRGVPEDTTFPPVPPLLSSALRQGQRGAPGPSSSECPPPGDLNQARSPLLREASGTSPNTISLSPWQHQMPQQEEKAQDCELDLPPLWGCGEVVSSGSRGQRAMG